MKGTRNPSQDQDPATAPVANGQPPPTAGQPAAAPAATPPPGANGQAGAAASSAGPGGGQAPPGAAGGPPPAAAGPSSPPPGWDQILPGADPTLFRDEAHKMQAEFLREVMVTEDLGCIEVRL